MSSVNVLRVAKLFCELSDWTITNLEIQKMAYIAHMFYLGKHAKHLVKGHFEAWHYGPVHPQLYHHVKAFGSRPVMNVFKYLEDISDPVAKELIESTYAVLAEWEAWELVGFMHRASGAWAKAYTRASGSIILDDEIMAEYEALQ